MDDLSEQVLKSYEIRERIGEGGFGAVYRAYQPAVDREVAIKVILPEHANQPDFVRRFEVEAQLIARLEHPHIVPLYDFWRDPQGAYLVMRWLKCSLKASLQQNSWSIEGTIQLLEQIAEALSIAHRSGVIHRDIKPDNILLDNDNNAYLADFGIAQVLNIGEKGEAGVIIGSPAYIAPEQIKGEQLTPQTDIYSLGLVIYEILADEKPYSDATTPAELFNKQLNAPLPFVTTRRPHLPEALNQVFQMATAKEPSRRYRSALDFAAAFQEAIANGKPRSTDQYDPNARIVIGPSTPDEQTVALARELLNPYKGLWAFQEADAKDFFGRQPLVDEFLSRLKENGTGSRFLVVIGPSGSGKSSVVKAGLIPALRRGALPNSNHWFISEMLPSTYPLNELEAALLRVAVNPLSDVSDQLMQDEYGLARVVKQMLPSDQDIELVLVIDQFEDMFTVLVDEQVRRQFIDNLVTAVTDPRGRIRVILTLRADFYDRPLLYPQLAPLIREHTAVVIPLTTDQLQEAISSPAKRVGVSFEPGLVQIIADKVADQSGTLPLLQYALTELFDRRDKLTLMLTLEAYRSSGGLTGALARRANELYDDLDAEGKAATRQLFLRLAALGEGMEDTQRRALRSELRQLIKNDRTMDKVIDIFGSYRLLTFDRDPILRSPTVEIAHEALIREWGRLRQWLNESRDDLRIQRRLKAAATEWLNSNQDTSFLASGARLVQFEALAAAKSIALSDDEKTYLKASTANRDQEERAKQEQQKYELTLAQESAAAQRQAANRLRYLVAVLIIFLLVAMGLSTLALSSRQQALDNAQAARISQQQSEQNARHTLSLRLAAAAAAEARDDNGELATVLALYSLKIEESPQGDAALQEALNANFAQRLFTGHTDKLTSVAYSRDGKYALTASADATVRLVEYTNRPRNSPV